MVWNTIIRWLQGALTGRRTNTPLLSDEDSADFAKPSVEAAAESARVSAEVSDVLTFEVHDRHLLDRVRTQWEHGAWKEMLAVSDAAVNAHPDAAQLRLMQAIAHLQAGDLDRGRQLLQKSLADGASESLARRVLLSGAMNSLARAHVVAGQVEQAQSLFHQSVCAGIPRCDSRLVAQSRVATQMAGLGIVAQPALTGATTGVPLIEPDDSVCLQVEQTASAVLGDAWSSNTVNTAIYRHHALLTSGVYQFIAFYRNAQTLCIARRDLDAGEITFFDLPGEYKIMDAHNSVTMGLDRNGCLHICYDHHASRLRYRKNRVAFGISDWTDELEMTGINEDKVTYPTFLLPSHGFPLTLLYRAGGHDRGCMRMKTYDEAQGRWHDVPQPLISGIDQKPWSSNPYWNHPVRGDDGCLHVSFVWRIQGLAEADRVANTNVCYARSYDNGVSWESSSGVRYKLPITPVTAEVIHAVPSNHNLINQCSMALVDVARPVIAFYAKDDAGNTQYMALIKTGNRWEHMVLTSDERQFELKGKGTLRIPMSRPEILSDHHGSVFVIYRAQTTGNRFSVMAFDARKPAPRRIHHWRLSDVDAGFSEPVIDRTRWQQESVLSMYVQHCDQPSGDGEVAPAQSPAMCADFKIRLVSNATSSDDSRTTDANVSRQAF